MTELNDNKGGKRDATIDETVRAAVMGQKADKDPIERYRQQAEKNGTNLKQVLDRVSEFDNIARLYSFASAAVKDCQHCRDACICGLFCIPSNVLQQVEHIQFYFAAAFLQGWLEPLSFPLGCLFFGIGFEATPRAPS